MKNVNYWIFPTKVGRKQPQARSFLCRPSRVEACCAQENAPVAHHRSAMPLGSSKNAPAAHHNAPAPHNGKPAAAHNDRHGADRHMAMNNGHSNKGHFGGRR